MNQESDEENKIGMEGVELEDEGDKDKSDPEFSDEDNTLLDDTALNPTPIGFWKPHYFFYVHTVLHTLIEKACEFAILYGLALAFKNSFILAPTVELVAKAMRLFLTPAMFNLIGKFSRFKFIGIITFGHSIMLVVSLVLILLINQQYAGQIIPWSTPGFLVMFIFLVITSIFSELGSLVCNLAFNTDWTPIIANSKQYLSNPTMADINSFRARLNMISNMMGPLLFGVVLYLTSMKASFTSLIICTSLSFFTEIILLYLLLGKYPELVGSRLSNLIPGERIDNQPTFNFEPLKNYFSQTCFLASLGNALLYLSALTPGVLIINYLVYEDALVIEIAIFQGISAGIGIFGALFSPKLIERIGLSKCTLITVWIYLSLLLISFSQVAIPDITIWLLIIPLIISRIIIWIFNLSAKQIMKESVLENQITRVQAIEFQLSHLFHLMILSLAIFSVTPRQFVFVAGGSLCFVFAACLLVTLWYRQHGHGHETLNVPPDMID